MSLESFYLENNIENCQKAWEKSFPFTNSCLESDNIHLRDRCEDAHHSYKTGFYDGMRMINAMLEKHGLEIVEKS